MIFIVEFYLEMRNSNINFLLTRRIELPFLPSVGSEIWLHDDYHPISEIIISTNDFIDDKIIRYDNCKIKITKELCEQSTKEIAISHLLETIEELIEFGWELDTSYSALSEITDAKFNMVKTNEPNPST